MLQYKFDRKKSINGLLLIAKALGGSVDRLKAFKIMYFADQKHLTKYGRPIFGDDYHALPYGPVPTVTYDYVNSIGSRKDFPVITEDKYLISNGEVDFDEFSYSDLECLKESLEENKNLSFTTLSRKSHKQAWQEGNTSIGSKRMKFESIAKEAGVSKEMSQYISLVSENLR
jgi:uncharacterized phage-associated protein